MERAYVEDDPASAPHVVAAPAQSSSVYPTSDYKYPYPEALGQASWALPPAAPSTQTTPVKKVMKRWMWILAGLAVVVIVVVAAVVGGVVGSRAAQKNDGQKTQSTGNNTVNTMTTTDPPTVTQTETAPSSATSSSTPNILARFYEFALDDCSGDSDTYNITSPGNMCYPVSSNKRSIFVSKNSNCIVSTRSGTDCGGKSFKVPDTGECHAVLYAAVSVVC